MKSSLIQLELDVFKGPLDLLLYLIDKNKVDIYDIPIVEITDQYLMYIDKLKEDKLNIMSEFMVMAATLIAIKTKMLLPRYEEIEDPRTELVEQLVEYKYYKEVANLMSDLEKKGYKSMVKPETIPEEVKRFEYKPNIEEIFDDIDLKVLYDTFEDLLKKAKDRIDEVRSDFSKIQEDRWNVSDKIIELRNQIKFNKKISFKKVIEDIKYKMEKIVIFLAILEMIKIGEIKINQSNLFDDIIISATNGGD